MLSLSIILNSNVYGTGRHFLFVHSALIFFSIYSCLYLKKLANLSLLRFILLFLTSPLLIASLLLKENMYLYRNEFVRILGVNVMESDYWATNRKDLKDFVGAYSNQILIESQWYQSNVRLFFTEYTFA